MTTEKTPHILRPLRYLRAAFGINSVEDKRLAGFVLYRQAKLAADRGDGDAVQAIARHVHANGPTL
jgi:hypothetical protein